MWLCSSVEDYQFNPGNSWWTPIPGATNSSYTINEELCQSRWYVRCSRNTGCDAWPGESNVIRVTINPVPTVLVSNTTYICNAPCTGTATAVAGSGTAPYSYSWNTGATTSSLSGLCNGTYSVTVTDAKGCTVVGSTTIECTPPPPCQNPVVSVTGGGTYCTATTASTVLTASPAGASSYVWNTGATTQAISVNASGTYSVTVTGVDYCTGTANASVTFKACCNVTNGGNIGQNQSFCGCVPAGTITFGQGLPTGGAGTIEYMWLYSNTGI
jgi:hypothetical protein